MLKAWFALGKAALQQCKQILSWHNAVVVDCFATTLCGTNGSRGCRRSRIIGLRSKP